MVGCISGGGGGSGGSNGNGGGFLRVCEMRCEIGWSGQKQAVCPLGQEPCCMLIFDFLDLQTACMHGTHGLNSFKVVCSSPTYQQHLPPVPG